MTAASAMKPRPAVMPFWNELGAFEREIRAGQPGEDAGHDDVPIPQPDDVDADGVGGARMLADGARAQPPSRAEEEHLEDDHEDDHRHRDRPLLEEHLEQPADDGDVDDLLREPERRERSRTEPWIRARSGAG